MGAGAGQIGEHQELRRKVLGCSRIHAVRILAADPGGQLAWGVPPIRGRWGGSDCRKRAAILHRMQRLVRI